MIGLVDYGLGNIQAFANIYHRLGIKAFPAKSPSDLRRASKIILPGVGSFDWAMGCLEKSGLREALDEEVLLLKKPVLGVCVGMQMMARCSEEGEMNGLGWISGEVRRFDETTLLDKTRLPHMGWNDVFPKDHPLFKGMTDPQFYFLHSYYFSTDSTDGILAETEYGGRFASAVNNQMIFGVQFHPEKSHHWGVQLLKNFAEI